MSSSAARDILRFVRFLTGDDSVFIDRVVANSEAQTGFRNIALANYMRSFDNIEYDVADALRVYFHQCAIAMTCTQLALAGRFLMMDGYHPDTGRCLRRSRAAHRGVDADVRSL